MGCDIHVWIEKRQPDGRWAIFREFSSWAFDDTMVDEEGEPLHPPDTYIPWDQTSRMFEEVGTRNYERFGRLAGVRSDGRSDGPEPKGWPVDADARLLKEAADHPDLHSHSWYSLAEAAQIWVDTMWKQDPARGIAYQNPAAMIFGINDDHDNYRVLFAFDDTMVDEEGEPLAFSPTRRPRS